MPEGLTLVKQARRIEGKLGILNQQVRSALRKCQDKPDPLKVPFIPGGFGGTPFAFLDFASTIDPRNLRPNYRPSNGGGG